MRPASLLAAAAVLAIVSPAPIMAQDARFEALAELPFVQNRPTPETAGTLRRELAFQQATQAYLWALPLINTLGMKFGSEEVFGAGYNVLPIWKDRLDPKTLVTTPNSDVIYAMGYVDMGETGPIVFEAPPNLQGILLDFWQRPIPVDGGEFAGDVGLPGPDAGKGGKFLVLPPGYDGEVPEGYYVYRSGTNNLFIFLRAFYQDPSDLSPAVTLMEQAKIYPLDLPEAERKPMEFPNASGVPANMLPRSDFSAFEQLKWLLDREGREPRGSGRPRPAGERGADRGAALRARSGAAGDPRGGRGDRLQDEPRHRVQRRDRAASRCGSGRTGNGSTRSTTPPSPARRSRATSRSATRPAASPTSRRAPGSPPTTTRSVPAWCRR